jgi:hypothetical protein
MTVSPLQILQKVQLRLNARFLSIGTNMVCPGCRVGGRGWSKEGVKTLKRRKGALDHVFKNRQKLDRFFTDFFTGRGGGWIWLDSVGLGWTGKDGVKTSKR